MSAVAIRAVQTRAELDRFIRLPARLSAGDPCFVTPLLLERREALSPAKNPYFEHAEAGFAHPTSGEGGTSSRPARGPSAAFHWRRRVPAMQSAMSRRPAGIRSMGTQSG